MTQSVVVFGEYVICGSCIILIHMSIDGYKKLFPCPANLDINIIRSLAIFRNDGSGSQIKSGLQEC